MGDVRRAYGGAKKRGSRSIHPDNEVPLNTLSWHLGFADGNLRTDPTGVDRGISRKGGLVVFGGPNSTRLTGAAWGFRHLGDNNYEMDDNWPIQLRYYGISNPNHPSIPKHRIQYRRPDGELCPPAVPWFFVDRHNPEWPLHQEKEAPLDEKGHIYRPKNNHLLITRLPQLLGDHIDGPDSLLVMEGNNGIGTRAAELLVTGRSRGVERCQETSRH
jgi:hypothetical protein